MAGSLCLESKIYRGVGGGVIWDQALKGHVISNLTFILKVVGSY